MSALGQKATRPRSPDRFPAKRERKQLEKPDTIAALVTSCMRSAAYVGLRDTTKTGYATRIELLRTKHGHRSVSGLSRQRIAKGILQPFADRPGAALTAC